MRPTLSLLGLAILDVLIFVALCLAAVFFSAVLFLLVEDFFDLRSVMSSP